jgi:type II secretory pathway component GspD/PulD (secretin)
LKDYAATIDAAKANAENLQVAGGLLARVSATPQDEGYKGPVHLKFNNEKHSFHESGSSRQLIPKVLLAYGIKAQMDASANSQTMRLDVDDMTAAEMIPLLDKMTQTFVVPLDEHSVMVGRDTQEVRDRLEPLLYETVYLPGMSDDDLKTMLAVTHDFFGIKQSAMQTSSQTLTVRATEETLTALNRTLADLMDDDSEVLMEVSLYELDTSRSQQTGVQAPQQLTAFNFDSEIQQVVQANQSTINQAISSGLIQQGNYLQYAELLLGAGLLNSTVFGQNFVLFGNGLTRTGLSGVGGTLNMALNTSEARMVDETHILAKNKVAGTFRAGERYPITTSTFSNVASAGTSAASLSGLSASQLALLGLSGAAGLASGTTQVIPQIQYEDLGLTLVTTPVIQRDGVVTLHFNLKLESLGGTSSNGIPILNNRAFSGDVTVQDGQSAVIVSTLTKQEVGAISGTPGVDEIPGFSDVFSSKSTNGIGQQLVLVVKPHLVRRAQNVYAGPMMMLSGHPVASASP